MFVSDEVIKKLQRKRTFKGRLSVTYVTDSITNMKSIAYDIELGKEYGMLQEENNKLTFCTNHNGKLKKWFEEQGIKVKYPWTL